MLYRRAMRRHRPQRAGLPRQPLFNHWARQAALRLADRYGLEWLLVSTDDSDVGRQLARVPCALRPSSNSLCVHRFLEAPHARDLTCRQWEMTQRPSRLKVTRSIQARMRCFLLKPRRSAGRQRAASSESPIVE